MEDPLFKPYRTLGQIQQPNPFRTLPGPSGQNQMVIHSDEHQISEDYTSKLVQRWLWGSHAAHVKNVKKIELIH